MGSRPPRTRARPPPRSPRTGVQVVVDARHVVTHVPHERQCRSSDARPLPRDQTAGSTSHWDPTWDYGTYATRICADVTRRVRGVEGGEERPEGPHHLGRSRSGSPARLSGEAHPSVSPAWRDPALAVPSRRHLPHRRRRSTVCRAGDPDYSFLDPAPASGVLDLQYTISGTNSLDGCTWEGTGGYEPAAEFHKVGSSFRPPKGSRARPDPRRPRPPAVPLHRNRTCPTATSATVDVVPANWGAPPTGSTSDRRAGRFPDPGLTRLEGDRHRHQRDLPLEPHARRLPPVALCWRARSWREATRGDREASPNSPHSAIRIGWGSGEIGETAG